MIRSNWAALSCFSFTASAPASQDFFPALASNADTEAVPDFGFFWACFGLLLAPRIVKFPRGNSTRTEPPN